MPARRPARAFDTRAFGGALARILPVAIMFMPPALAQIETVIVTAERKAEDMQTAPLSLSAFTTSDMQAQQIHSFNDLQFYVPGVTFTKTQFGGAQFQIRGVTTQFGLGAAIAQNENDIYLEATNLASGEYYDVRRIEIARGPQSTSYGRAATGGAVNVVTAKPDLESFAARASLDYGSYNTLRPDAMLNLPLVTGVLGLRIALHGAFHDGYEKNVYAGPQLYPGSPVNKDVNGQGLLAGRATLRWRPDADTVLDIFIDTSVENDSHTRADKQLCHRDPSGVLGCLPDALGFDGVNQYASVPLLQASVQGLSNFSPALAPMALVNLQNPNGVGSGLLPAGAIPHDLLTVDTAFNPKYKGNSALLGVNWAQTLSPWLKATLDAGYDQTGFDSMQAFAIAPPENIQSAITRAVGGFNQVLANPLVGASLGLPKTGFVGVNAAGGAPGIGTASASFSPIYLNLAAGGAPITSVGALRTALAAGVAVPSNSCFLAGAFFAPAANSCSSSPAPYNAAYFGTVTGAPAAGSVAAMNAAPVYGALPLSSSFYNGLFGSYGGIIDNSGGGVLTFSPYALNYDRASYRAREWTGELRLRTDFAGPLNFSAGAFYMSFQGRNQYWVSASSFDYSAIVLGSFLGNALAGRNGLVAALPQVDIEYRRNDILSRSAFLETTYEALPGTLKFIAGLRFNDDRESKLSGAGAGYTSGGGAGTLGVAGVTLAPIGGAGVTRGAFNRQPFAATGDPVAVTDRWTGRFVADYTPKLDFTDQTLIYASASRGVLAGGVNVPNNGQSIVELTYKPATVDALELGTKNMLLDGMLKADLAAWYYNYQNYQVGLIVNGSNATLNVPAHLWGLESEMVWQPTEKLAFNLSLSLTQSQIGRAAIVDPRNPGNGDPNAIVIKDLTTGENCVVTRTSAAPGATPASAGVPGFYTPQAISAANPSGSAGEDAPYGVPWVNFGQCAVGGVQTSQQTVAVSTPAQPIPHIVANPAPKTNQQLLAAAGFTYSSLPGAKTPDGVGIAKNLHGNQLPQVPRAQIGVGAQYIYTLDGGYTLVPRVDYYWQASMRSRIWNDPGIDRIAPWGLVNLGLQLNAPGEDWYARLYATNLLDSRNVTGQYLQDAIAGLYTNIFVENPRVIGVSLGANF
jgi:outer membrane receptor protein involved in Fe transport